VKSRKEEKILSSRGKKKKKGEFRSRGLKNADRLGGSQRIAVELNENRVLSMLREKIDGPWSNFRKGEFRREEKKKVGKKGKEGGPGSMTAAESQNVRGGSPRGRGGDPKKKEGGGGWCRAFVLVGSES